MSRDFFQLVDGVAEYLLTIRNKTLIDIDNRSYGMDTNTALDDIMPFPYTCYEHEPPFLMDIIRKKVDNCLDQHSIIFQSEREAICRNPKGKNFFTDIGKLLTSGAEDYKDGTFKIIGQVLNNSSSSSRHHDLTRENEIIQEYSGRNIRSYCFNMLAWIEMRYALSQLGEHHVDRKLFREVYRGLFFPNRLFADVHIKHDGAGAKGNLLPIPTWFRVKHRGQMIRGSQVTSLLRVLQTVAHFDNLTKEKIQSLHHDFFGLDEDETGFMVDRAMIFGLVSYKLRFFGKSQVEAELYCTKQAEILRQLFNKKVDLLAFIATETPLPLEGFSIINKLTKKPRRGNVGFTLFLLCTSAIMHKYLQHQHRLEMGIGTNFVEDKLNGSERQFVGFETLEEFKEAYNLPFGTIIPEMKKDIEALLNARSDSEKQAISNILCWPDKTG